MQVQELGLISMASGDEVNADRPKSQVFHEKLTLSKNAIRRFLPYGAVFSSGVFGIDVMAPTVLAR